MLFPGVDPEFNEELLRAEAEPTQTFGSQLPSLEAAVNVTQGYYLLFKACAESNGFQIARERQAIRDMLQRSVVDWMVGKGLDSSLTPPHECLRTYLARLTPFWKDPLFQV